VQQRSTSQHTIAGAPAGNQVKQELKAKLPPKVDIAMEVVSGDACLAPADAVSYQVVSAWVILVNKGRLMICHLLQCKPCYK
jgi:hypothetical protein